MAWSCWFPRPTLTAKLWHWWSWEQGGGNGRQQQRHRPALCWSYLNLRTFHRVNTPRFVMGFGWSPECRASCFWVLSGFISCVLGWRFIRLVNFVIAAFSSGSLLSSTWVLRPSISPCVLTGFLPRTAYRPIELAEYLVAFEKIQKVKWLCPEATSVTLLIFYIRTTPTNTSPLITFLSKHLSAVWFSWKKKFRRLWGFGVCGIGTEAWFCDLPGRWFTEWFSIPLSLRFLTLNCEWLIPTWWGILEIKRNIQETSGT